MANQPRESNRHRSVRFEEDEWEPADTVTQEMGTNRTAVLNQALRWYLRRPGAKLPERPPAELVETHDKAWRERKAARDAAAKGEQP